MIYWVFCFFDFFFYKGKNKELITSAMPTCQVCSGPGGEWYEPLSWAFAPGCITHSTSADRQGNPVPAWPPAVMEMRTGRILGLHAPNVQIEMVTEKPK